MSEEEQASIENERLGRIEFLLKDVSFIIGDEMVSLETIDFYNSLKTQYKEITGVEYK